MSSGRASDRPPSYIDAVTFASALLGCSADEAALVSALVDGRGAVLVTDVGARADTVDLLRSQYQAAPGTFATSVAANVDQLEVLLGNPGRVTALVGAARDPALAPQWAAANGDVGAFARGLTAAQVASLLPAPATIEALLDDLPTKADASTLSDLLTANGADPGRFAAALAGDTRPGVLPALLSVAGVGDRIRQLEAEGNLAAAPIRQAWTDAVGYRAFASALGTPPLIAQVTAQTGQVSERLERLAATQPQLGGALVDLWARAGADFGKFRHEVEDWFDREMARVSGWYSRWAQWLMLGIAIILAALLNISAVTVAKVLWEDPTLRSQVVAEAQQEVASSSTTVAGTAAPSATTPPTTAAGSSTPEPELPLPVGWSSRTWPGLDWYLPLHLLGILLVGIAASFGAPFWFDLLNRVVNLRMSGTPPATAADQRAAASS